jgi:glucosylceramidase
MLTTAWINPDGKVAVIVLNVSEEKITFRLWLKGQAAAMESLPHSIMTSGIN